jgi:hypothetical protein
MIRTIHWVAGAAGDKEKIGKHLFNPIDKLTSKFNEKLYYCVNRRVRIEEWSLLGESRLGNFAAVQWLAVVRRSKFDIDNCNQTIEPSIKDEKEMLL